MKHMIKTAGHAWTDYKTNKEMEKKINITRFGRNTEIQKVLVATLKQHAL